MSIIDDQRALATEVEQLLRDAFQALLRGDLAERDRLCDLAKEKVIAGEQLAAEVKVQTYRKPGSA